MNVFYDIHTHQSCATEGVIAIHNYSLPFTANTFNSFCSVGLHPMHVQSISQCNDSLAMLKQSIGANQIMCVGECGLDKSIDVDFSLQMYAFEQQVLLALQWKKPLIIHCVKAYSDILHVLKKTSFPLPIIFHKYNANEQITAQLLKYHSYFSFGAELFTRVSAQTLLTRIPAHTLFFETDNSAYTIQQVYIQAAEVLSTSIENLCHITAQNFYTLVNN